MKALTVCQPYANLIAQRIKRVENRSWSTRYRGELAIHAGKSRDWLRFAQPSADMVFGAVVAVATLTDVLHIDLIERGDYDQSYPWLREHEHTEGEWCWVLENVRKLETPIPWKGAQGLWVFDGDLQ